MPLGIQVGLGLGHIVLDGDPAHLPKKVAEPPSNFRRIFIVTKRLDGSRCHLVYREASAQATLCYMRIQHPSSKRGRSLPNFWLMSIVANGCMDQDALGTELGLGLRDIVFDVYPATPRKKGHTHPT